LGVFTPRLEFRRMLVRGSAANRLLRFALVTVAGAWSLLWLVLILVNYPVAADVDIPLRAAERWLSGGKPYLPESFAVSFGRDLPFLYPPFVLPLLAPLTALPRGLPLLLGLGLNVMAAMSICRSLAVPRTLRPLMLLWPPFIEGIWVANIQVVLVALFLWIFWGGEPLGPWRPRLRERPATEAESIGHGAAGAFIAAIKVSQVHPWLLVLRDRPRAALKGAAIVGLVLLATLPLTGLEIYRAWLTHLAMASDPAWLASGSPISSIIGRIPAFALAVLTLPLVLVLPRLVGRSASPAWVGLLVILAAPNIHPYYFLFMCPAMLLIRREVALVAAVLVASYWPGTEWIAFAIVAGSLGLSHIWNSALEQPTSTLEAQAEKQSLLTAKASSSQP
jgi:Glycosyltransferase family 87